MISGVLVEDICVFGPVMSDKPLRELMMHKEINHAMAARE